ncbi:MULTISPECIES: DUF2336 domain-containing protein [Bradyrhizobium]|uniref:Bll3075 protein n=1 Tax=Bradyrhizobium diazoefficiens (strain JCM 10833 / BCRC 13528 / IAM 13628 / NBRC 14792 / USDA 110) TaxID=224911 RepID=Q89QP9_BRADU|nr:MULTISPECIES: DUF2336 domain-containing protein [Bradyrhizobium]AND88518.1 flagellar biosynthesis protein FlhF [Bradyrhizobium diazoefficiens USDA 110]AWO90071.1 DUF2336 domain-containing protein [Bradyrhizobium diazoefficiens]MDA9394427.1 flagellar biosynthesis protein FlhF [Bradyrhizobium sp. CCBAU 45394]MDA9542961.1 flagellar biosynthesis protein FlhF [Bradyrhizobium sp. CCBAU 21362]PDT63281.1 DUF2336 domain-containing protein [Bradyrhizobium diazoefficiens]
MTKSLFPGFDGLMTLSRREGVDVRPTLLRVLTDLYVQTRVHSEDEQRQFVELATRLIDQVDDATRAAVKARLAVYPQTPVPILQKLGLVAAQEGRRVPLAREIAAPPPAPSPVRAPTEAEQRMASNMAMQPTDAAEIHDMFFHADASQRALILHNLEQTPLKAAPRIPTVRAKRAIQILEMAAIAGDVENFTYELGDSLILPSRVAAEIVDDPGGEALAVAARALDMPSPNFQRILLFFKPEIGNSVNNVYRLSRLYDRLGERSALVMLAAWRGSALAVTRAKYQSSLHDGERQRARAGASQTRPGVQPGSSPTVRTGTGGSSDH